MTRGEVIQEARKWLGVKWHHQGRSSTGVDCVGLIIVVGQHFSVEHTDLIGYSRQPTDLTFIKQLRKYLTRAPRDGDRVGTIGVFRQSVFPCHVGIFSAPDRIIHARASAGRVVEEHFVDGLRGLNLAELMQFPQLES